MTWDGLTKLAIVAGVGSFILAVVGLRAAASRKTKGRHRGPLIGSFAVIIIVSAMFLSRMIHS